MNKNILLGCAAGLLSLAATAQDEVAADASTQAEPEAAVAGPEGNAWTALQDRWYVTPALSWVLADSGRETDDGLGASIAAGRRWSEDLGIEVQAQYNRFDHEQGSSSADLYGLGINGLFFPAKVPAYLLLGAGYGRVYSHPGARDQYGTFLLNVGGGYWWKPFDLGFKGVSLRTEAVYRLDAHNDRRTGNTIDNGRKAFGDIVLTVGLNIPLGEVPAPPPEPVPVEVVPLVAAGDSDSDGVPDDLDQCPGTPAGTAVDEKGCPVVVSTCKSPAPGEKLDLAGCATGDTIVLKGVNFEFDRNRLTPDARNILDGVDEALQAAATTNVEIAGHTDALGSDEYNQRLSERRACSVARYLNGKGIEAARMTPRGYGESSPIADNESDAGREQNRRVELRILDGAGAGLGACAAPPRPPAPAAAVSEAPAAVEEPVASEPSPGAAEAPADSSGGSYMATESSLDAVQAEPAPEPAAPEPAAVAAPEPAATETPGSPPPASMPPSGSSDAMQQVPESEVFGTAGATESREAASPPASAAPSTPASRSTPASSTEMVPESEVFGE